MYDFHVNVQFEHDDQDLIEYKMYLYMPIIRIDYVYNDKKSNYILDKYMQNVYHLNVLTYVFYRVNV